MRNDGNCADTCVQGRELLTFIQNSAPLIIALFEWVLHIATAGFAAEERPEEGDGGHRPCGDGALEGREGAKARGGVAGCDGGGGGVAEGVECAEESWEGGDAHGVI